MPTEKKDTKKKAPVKKVAAKKEEVIVAAPVVPVLDPIVADIVDDEEQRAIDAAIAAADKEAGAKEKFYQSVGRRKESVARVRLFTRKSSDSVTEDKGLIIVNGKDYIEYFKVNHLIATVEAPLRKLKSLHRFKATVQVKGGGVAGQADAVRHGIAQTLEEFDSNFRKKLKKSGYLTRDPRAKERRKYGHKKARKSGRWSKR